MRMNKRNIALLDLGGVVFQSTGVSNGRIDWEIISSLNNKYGYELNIGKDVFPVFLAEYNALTQQLLTGETFLREVFDTLAINTELVDMIRAERDIVIVSDNYRENIAYISQRYDFASWSIQQIYSFDYGMEKAHPSFFARLLSDLSDYGTAEMLYIDDSEHKLDSAAQHAIEGIFYQNNHQVERALREYQAKKD